MTSSLDGFVADQDGSAGRLYPDLAALRGTPYMNAMIEETGAVLMGKRTFEMAEDPDWYVGQYEFQVPLFVLTHEPPQVTPKQDERLTFTFVTDGVESAVEQATAVAGNKAVGGIQLTGLGWGRGRAAASGWRALPEVDWRVPTACSNSPSRTIQCDIATWSSTHSRRRRHPCRRAYGGTRRAWTAHERRGHGEHPDLG
jgi:dihydrofolate reductase